MNAREFRLGISTHAFTNLSDDRLPIRVALERVRDAGGVSTMLLHRPGAEPWTRSAQPATTCFDVLGSAPDVIARECATLGIHDGVLRLTDATIEASLPGFQRAAEVSRALGWRRVMFKSLPVEAPLLPPRAKRSLIERCAAFIAGVAAMHADIRWCVDIHYNSSIETVADAEYFLARTPPRNVGVCLNIGHMTSLHQPGWVLLDRHPSRVHVIAWKDHLVGGLNGLPIVSVESGTGDSPFECYIQTLKSLPVDPLHLFALENCPDEARVAICARSHRQLIDLWRRPEAAIVR